MKRQNEIARLAGVPVNALQEVLAHEVRQALADRVPAVVLEVATQEPATYWRVGDGDYWLDDPFFGEPVRIVDLDYDREIGLHKRMP